MKEKLKSPVVWGAVLTTIYTQLQTLQNTKVDWWNITMAVITVGITFFAALNNPNDRKGF